MLTPTVVVIVVLVLVVLFVGRRGGKSIREQIAAVPGNARPHQELASAKLEPGGRPAELNGVAGVGHHAVWMEYEITTNRAQEWSAQMSVEKELGTSGPSSETFTISHDGEDHRTAPGVKGMVWFPKEGSAFPSTDQGHMKVASFEAQPGTPIRIRVTITPSGPWANASLRLYIGVSRT